MECLRKYNPLNFLLVLCIYACARVSAFRSRACKNKLRIYLSRAISRIRRQHALGANPGLEFAKHAHELKNRAQ